MGSHLMTFDYCETYWSCWS